MHLMAYDFAGAWNGKTGFNAPISDVDNAVKYWTNQGAPKSKLVLGMPLYGRSFTLSTADNGIGAATSGVGTAGPYLREPGFLGYNEVNSDGFDASFQIYFLFFLNSL
jgi:chitinase